LKRSTWNMLKRHGWRVDKMIHNYFYYAFYYPYVKIVYHTFAILSRYMSWFKPLNPIIRAAFNRYHAKVLSFSDTRKIFELNEDISEISSRNKRIIPYRYAHRIILKEPEYIAVMDCPCKLTLGAPAWSINSCISVGRVTSEFWLNRCQKYHARRISQAVALEIIKRFRKEGYLTQAFFKVATGGCTGVICNCHVDSCVSLQATRFANRFDGKLSMQAESGYSVRRDPDRCQGCNTCGSYCMFDAIAHHPENGWRYDPVACLGCGLCTEHCPADALTLYEDGNKSQPLDLDRVREFGRDPESISN